MSSEVPDLEPLLRDAIGKYFRILERNADDGHITLTDLARTLDQLVSAYFATYETDPGGSEAPERDMAQFSDTYQRIAKAYPELSHYTHCWPNDVLDKSECGVADAIDDLADIYGDLVEVVWLLDNADLATAVWQFRWGYQYHWGVHLHALRSYLHSTTIAAW